MRTLGVAWRYLWSRPLAAALNLLLLTLGLASITFVVLIDHHVGGAFERGLARIDAVVGAKGSPMQLILAGVFHIDVPPGNIPLAEVEKLSRHPHVAQVIPMAMGDSFRGFRIVGTTEAYLQHYGVQLASGAMWKSEMQAVVGAETARALSLAPGVAFSGSHGIAGGSAHDEKPYRVVGVLAPCACVVDRLILTGLESVWHVHEMPHEKSKEAEHGAGHEADHEPERDVTMALVRYRTPLAAATFPRFVNTQTPMQAAAPALEVTRLLGLVGVGTDVLRWIGAVLLLTAALSVFISLWSAVRERRADHAMLRMLGATPAKVAALLMCEALLLAAMASVLGVIAGHALAAVVSQLLQERQSLAIDGWRWVAAEAWVPVAALAVAAVAALVPALHASRVDVGDLLNAR